MTSSPRDDETRFSPAVRDALAAAGWSPGRRVPDDELREWAGQLDGFTMSSAAERVLREFGGLSVDGFGPGLEVAREPFAIDPLVAIGEDDHFRRLTDEYGVELFPLGEAAQHFYFLAIDPDGRTYLAMEDVSLLGESFDEALEALVAGRLATPIPKHSS
jgi:hypothetical protein